MQVERKFKKVPIESKQEHLEPHHKKTKLSNFITTKFTLYQPCPNYIKLKIQYYICAISSNMFDKIPMWTGWNVINSINVSQKQMVCYMKPIQLPPTRIDVVKEMMKYSIDIANTVKQRQVFVTYELAIAKITKIIQSEESPIYDNLFIMFGSFSY